MIERQQGGLVEIGLVIVVIVFGALLYAVYLWSRADIGRRAAEEARKDARRARDNQWWRLQDIIEQADDGSPDQSRALDLLGKMTVYEKEWQILRSHADLTKKPILRQAAMEALLKIAERRAD